MHNNTCLGIAGTHLGDLLKSLMTGGGWPISYRGPSRETVLAKINAVKK